VITVISGWFSEIVKLNLTIRTLGFSKYISKLHNHEVDNNLFELPINNIYRIFRNGGRTQNATFFRVVQKSFVNNNYNQYKIRWKGVSYLAFVYWTRQIFTYCSIENHFSVIIENINNLKILHELYYANTTSKLNKNI